MNIVPKIKVYIYWIVAFTAIIFLTLGLSSGKRCLKYVLKGEKTNAIVSTVISNEYNKIIKYSFNVNGVEYSGETNVILNKGEEINIYYYPDKPSDNAYLPPIFKIFIIFTVICLPTFIIFFIILYKYYKYVSKVKKLIKDNHYEIAIITNIETFDNEHSFGITPFIITCEYNNKEYKSKLVYKNIDVPETIIGYKIKLYLNDDFYYIDSNSYER